VFAFRTVASPSIALPHRDRETRFEDAIRLSYRGAVVMLSPANSPHAIRPCATPKETGKLVGGTYLFVDDVDAHLEKARRAGADVIMKATDMPYGDRVYCALDPEGHLWAFATHQRDPAPKT
jgi:uncharacterized glyoxalase superfamily protein PhnB